MCTPTRTEALLLVTIGLGFHEAPGCLVRTFKVYIWSQNSLGEVRPTVEEKKTPHLISQESVRSWPGPRGGSVSL